MSFFSKHFKIVFFTNSQTQMTLSSRNAVVHVEWAIQWEGHKFISQALDKTFHNNYTISVDVTLKCDTMGFQYVFKKGGIVTEWLVHLPYCTKVLG